MFTDGNRPKVTRNPGLTGPILNHPHPVVQSVGFACAATHAAIVVALRCAVNLAVAQAGVRELPLRRDAISGWGSPGQTAERAEERDHVPAAIADLPDSIREVVVLHYVGGLTYQQGTFSLAVREEPLLRRPYTQKERLFRSEVRETGGIPTLNRLVAYFDEDPKFGSVQEFSERSRPADRRREGVDRGQERGSPVGGLSLGPSR